MSVILITLIKFCLLCMIVLLVQWLPQARAEEDIHLSLIIGVHLL